MNEMIRKYRALSFEERTIFNAGFSIVFNFILAIGKIILSFFYGVFFLVAGIVNVLIMLTKLECYLGVKYPNKATFKRRNILTSIFLMLAGLEYGIYMTRMIFTDIELMQYNMFLGICIACVAFVEMGIAIKGCFNSFGKGHYYRNIKLINLCSAFTAIALTEVAIMSFASEADSRIIDGLFGLVVGGIIVLIGLFILISPRFSIVDREHNVYKAKDKVIIDNSINLKLTNSRFYRSYYYEAIVTDNIIDGHIKKSDIPIFKWNIFVLILVFILSEILIFPYAAGALITYFKNGSLINKLDTKMNDLGYTKISEGEGADLNENITC